MVPSAGVHVAGAPARRVHHGAGGDPADRAESPCLQCGQADLGDETRRKGSARAKGRVRSRPIVALDVAAPLVARPVWEGLAGVRSPPGTRRGSVKRQDRCPLGWCRRWEVDDRPGRCCQTGPSTVSSGLGESESGFDLRLSVGEERGVTLKRYAPYFPDAEPNPLCGGGRYDRVPSRGGNPIRRASARAEPRCEHCPSFAHRRESRPDDHAPDRFGQPAAGLASLKP